MLLSSEIFVLLVLISINVPPLKSMPRFNPLKTNNNTEITIKNDDSITFFF